MTIISSVLTGFMMFLETNLKKEWAEKRFHLIKRQLHCIGFLPRKIQILFIIYFDISSRQIFWWYYEHFSLWRKIFKKFWKLRKFMKRYPQSHRAWHRRIHN